MTSTAFRYRHRVGSVVEVLPGKSFLALKAEDVKRATRTYRTRIPLVLMNSFSTRQQTHQHLIEKRYFGLRKEDILMFDQSVSLRLTSDGSLFLGADGMPSYYAPGHGDFFASVRSSGVLSELRRRGIRTLLFSNVDNLGATIDPLIIGHHLHEAADMSIEITEKRRTAGGGWDKGGAPAYVDGQLQIVEGFRFPKDFPQEKLPDLNTNNMLFQTAAIDRDITLEHHIVQKNIDGQNAWQLESITCEASGLRNASGAPLFKCAFLRVQREGPRGRFFPIKEPLDLSTQQEIIRKRLQDGWALRENPPPAGRGNS